MTSVLKLRNILGDIYKDFPINDWPEDMQGMGGDAGEFAHMVETVKPKVIVEVGSWKGLSVLSMAKECQRLGLDTTIICVDTWLGSEEHWRTSPHDLGLINGRPTLYQIFVANMIHEKLTDIVIPLSLPSVAAADLLKSLGVESDLTYIDASHDYDSVSLDLKKYWQIRSKNGIIFGHDIGWAPVEEAVKDFCKSKGIEFKYIPPFWRLLT